MRIVFMGTPDFAVPSLQRLLADGREVVGVFTQPDRPKGRGYKLAPPPVKVLALEEGIPVYQPEKMRDGAALAQLQALQPDLVVVAAYGRILPPDLLAVPRLGCLNVHGSLLPQYRGAAPIQWSVLGGDSETGVTIMQMAEGLDTGDILLQRATPIGPDETAGELFDRLALLGAQALSEALALLEAGALSPTPQEEALATYAPPLQKAQATLDFARPARSAHNQVRGLNPWPVARTTLDGRLLKVYSSRPVSGKGQPGQVLEGKNRLVVACGEGALEILELQAEGGKRLPAADFLRGHPVETGRLLGQTNPK